LSYLSFLHPSLADSVIEVPLTVAYQSSNGSPNSDFLAINMLKNNTNDERTGEFCMATS